MHKILLSFTILLFLVTLLFSSLHANDKYDTGCSGPSQSYENEWGAFKVVKVDIESLKSNGINTVGNAQLQHTDVKNDLLGNFVSGFSEGVKTVFSRFIRKLKNIL
ncbi:hypothetical protein ACFLTD_01375 [Elusimicrobiota bacterium]